MNYNYIIVEDDLGNLKNLQTALKLHLNFKEIGVVHSVSKGISLAFSTKPHIIFLDVELGDENGFDLVNEIRQLTTEIPFIIMTTAHDKYAKKAVNNDVLYFLDKPIDPDELITALALFEKRYLEKNGTLIIKKIDGEHHIKFADIYFIEGKGSYSYIYTVNNKEYKFSKDLKYIVELLPSNFKRIQKSYIINNNYKSVGNSQKIYLRELPINYPLTPIKNAWCIGINRSDKY